MLANVKPKDNHTSCIFWLIINFEEARQFFCGADITYKDKLVLLVEEQGILNLEVLNPYVLKLGLFG